MDEAWERALSSAAAGQADPRAVTLDGSVKCLNGRLPSRLFERFQNLEHLSLANVRLASLEGFPRLPNLRRLILSDNQISGGLEFLVAAGLDGLRHLDLSNNRIQSLEDLAPLKKIRLVSLDVYECPVTKTDAYSNSKVLVLIKSLKYVNNVDGDGNERPETDDEEEEDDEGEEDDEEVDMESGEGEDGDLGEETDDEAEEDDEQGEDAEDDGEGVEEEENIGAEYSMLPVAQPKELKVGASDACNEEDRGEEVEDDEDHRSSRPKKRMKGDS